MADPLCIEDLRRAALLLNTKRGLPQLLTILGRYGAKCISEVPANDRWACAVSIIREKTMHAYSSWLVSQ